MYIYEQRITPSFQNFHQLYENIIEHFLFSLYSYDIKILFEVGIEAKCSQNSYELFSM